MFYTALPSLNRPSVPHAALPHHLIFLHHILHHLLHLLLHHHLLLYHLLYHIWKGEEGKDKGKKTKEEVVMEEGEGFLEKFPSLTTNLLSAMVVSREPWPSSITTSSFVLFPLSFPSPPFQMW